jgi:hypothetical protein
MQTKAKALVMSLKCKTHDSVIPPSRPSSGLHAHVLSHHRDHVIACIWSRRTMGARAGDVPVASEVGMELTAAAQATDDD